MSQIQKTNLSIPIHVGRPNIGDRQSFLNRVNEILDRNWLTNNGPVVQEFEQKLAQYLGVRHVMAMCNGTVALEIAIRALELEGEVILPSYTFIATAHAIFWQGLTPVFADINPTTHNLDPDAVRRMITPKTSGIVGVHLWGRGADVSGLQEIADEHGLKLMFDAAHAFGCSYQGKMIGNFGACEVFSFHATKFFNSLEGGAIATNDDQLAEKIKLMRNFGFSGYDNVIYPGTNGKMNEICAAMGLTNLEYLQEILKINRRNYLAYQEAINPIPGVSILTYPEIESNNFQYIILEVAPEFPVSRDTLVNKFHEANILARKYFWPGCHNMKPYKDLFPNANLLLKNTELVADRVIVLPTGLSIELEDIDMICDIINKFLQN
ncbi:DegT/DnrJ/EryC1/StrS family aminotransferase [Nodularia spumigena CS-591/12]|uniref:DegT/DnrJ/EryC1/StrS family aminotransferase n=1 Tax=Nodularia spumigena TaxID=70799 RepID=UPI00232B7055|nr:DegT/DnrJ/EryC1/StrS family aminotransferase [Nodularia spumigena]MDB9304549.1 DegT/DnrJ/EryC1/StrS family aminotransferase [Nodularia spumigena CS-591/12]